MARDWHAPTNWDSQLQYNRTFALEGGGYGEKLNSASFGLSSLPLSSMHEENHQSRYYHRCYNPAN